MVKKVSVAILQLLFVSLAQTTWGSEYSSYDKAIDLYYQTKDNADNDVTLRLQEAANFLSGPYRDGPLGEGKNGRFDSEPLYRTDTFDCQTFVETALALALSKDLKEFQTTVKKVRYRNGQISFLKRNHFVSLDWNKNNEELGFIKDITRTIVDKNNKPIAKLAQTTIDKPSWHQHLTAADIELASNVSPKLRRARLSELQSLADSLRVEQAKVWYLPLTSLFTKDGKANEFLLKQIPLGAIIQIVRPDWNVKDSIGTNINVSHLGVTVGSENELMFRSASEPYKRVINVPIVRYLRRYLKDATVGGISVYLPTVPHF